eukprot:970073-Pelagomonas_calceolata.AAC.4
MAICAKEVPRRLTMERRASQQKSVEFPSRKKWIEKKAHANQKTVRIRERRLEALMEIAVP